MNVILVLQEDQFGEWKNICSQYSFDRKVSVVLGGKTRYGSVRNGLEKIANEDSVIGIHDGARPLVTSKIIEDVYETAIEKGNAVPVIDAKDSIRYVGGKLSKSVSRKEYKIVQTPQCFWHDQLYKGYQQKYRPEFTDDASVVEGAGFGINLVQGDERNIKITTPMDLVIAEEIIKQGI